MFYAFILDTIFFYFITQSMFLTTYLQYICRISKKKIKNFEVKSIAKFIDRGNVVHNCLWRNEVLGFSQKMDGQINITLLDMYREKKERFLF